MVHFQIIHGAFYDVEYRTKKKKDVVYLDLFELCKFIIVVRSLGDMFYCVEFNLTIIHHDYNVLFVVKMKNGIVIIDPHYRITQTSPLLIGSIRSVWNFKKTD